MQELFFYILSFCIMVLISLTFQKIRQQDRRMESIEECQRALQQHFDELMTENTKKDEE